MLSTPLRKNTLTIWASSMCDGLNTSMLRLQQPLKTDFSKIEINTKEDSTVTMMSDGDKQDVDSVADKGTKGDNQTGHQT